MPSVSRRYFRSFPFVVSCLLFLLFPDLALRAGPGTVDSLRQLIRGAAEDSSRVRLLNALAMAQAADNPHAAGASAQEALSLAERLGWAPGIAESCNTAGALHTNTGNYDRALVAFHRALRLEDSLGNTARAGRALRNLGVVYRRIGQLDKALEYTQQSVDLCRTEGNDIGYAYALSNVGNLYNQMKQYREALEAFSECERIFRETDQSTGLAAVYNGMGIANTELGRHDRALTYYQKSLALAEKLGDTRSVTSLKINMGSIYLNMGDPATAVRYEHAALENAERIGATDLVLAAIGTLGQGYAAAGRFDSAYHYSRRYAAMKDSLLDAEGLRQVNELSARFEAERREQRIALLEKEQELQQARISRESLLRNVVIAGFVIALAFALWILRQARMRKRMNDQLRAALRDLQQAQHQLVHSESMATVGRMAAGIAHEIKNPLNFITNFADISATLLRDIRGQSIDTEDARDALETLETNIVKIKDHGRRADGIIRNLLDHAGGATGHAEIMDVHPLLKRSLALALHGMHLDAPAFDITIKERFDPSIGLVTLDARGMTRVILNLFRNAFEATHRKQATAPPDYRPAMEITTLRTDTGVEIRFRDNGDGVPQDIRDRIFEPFFTTKPTGTGTGLGLSLSYDIVVEGHGGTMTLSSPPDGGAEFVITIPM